MAAGDARRGLANIMVSLIEILQTLVLFLGGIAMTAIAHGIFSSTGNGHLVIPFLCVLSLLGWIGLNGNMRVYAVLSTIAMVIGMWIWGLP